MARRIDAEAAIITGASSGLGTELAFQLAARGVRVGLTARRRERLEAIAFAIRAQGGTAAVAPADASDGPATRAAIRRLDQAIGPTDLLIANAGVGTRAPGARFSAEAFEHILRVNLTGAAHAIETVLPNMITQRRGTIVGISSLAGLRGLPGTAAYSASKAGLSTLLESLRVDLRGSGLSVITVEPGFLATPMIAGARVPTPWTVDVYDAAEAILQGIARQRRVIHVPWRTFALMKIIQALPRPFYDRLAARFVPTETPHPAAANRARATKAETETPDA